MARFARWCALAGAGALAVPAALMTPLDAQSAQPRQRSISRMEIEYSDPYTCVGFGQVRELSDGRLIVADPTEKRLEVIDLRRGSGTKISRQGAGPGEWGVPMALVPMGGDTTLLYDPQNTRMLVILPTGGVAEDPIPLSTSGRGIVSIRGPRGYDRAGRLYFQGSNFTVTRGGGPPVSSDSAPITRLDPRASRLDTVGFLPMPRPEIRTAGDGSGGGRGMTVMVRLAANPFVPRAGWTVLPSGQIAIVRPEPYRVELVGANGARTTGPAATYEKFPVTDADKEGTRPRAPSCSISITRDMGGGARATTERAMVTARAAAAASPPPDRDDWPEFKPPFLGSQEGAVVGTPTGEIWVLRAREANDDTPHYDVFDSRGQIVSRVVLPKGARLLGFGNGSIYLSRMDDDDLVYIQRWRMDTP